MYKHKCLNCEKEFYSGKAIQKFCSYECFVVYRQKEAFERKLKLFQNLIGKKGVKHDRKQER